MLTVLTQLAASPKGHLQLSTRINVLEYVYSFTHHTLMEIFIFFMEDA
jgi:hypothetical protein